LPHTGNAIAESTNLKPDTRQQNVRFGFKPHELSLNDSGKMSYSAKMFALAIVGICTMEWHRVPSSIRCQSADDMFIAT